MRKHPWILVCIAIIAIVVVFNAVYDGKFLTYNNITSVLSHAIIPAFVAWGLTFVFGCDFTDMSIGAVIVLAANVAAVAGNRFGYPGLIAGGILVSVFLVTLNFVIFETTKIPSWVSSIGLTLIYEAIALFWSYGRSQQGLTMETLGKNVRGLVDVPVIYIIFFIGLALAYIIYNNTSAGIKIRALGSGLDISKTMGINVAKTLITAGLIAGFFVGGSVILNISYNVRLAAKSGLTSMTAIFQPMAAYMLALVLGARINIIIAVPICAVLVYSIFNMLTIMGVPSGTWQDAVLGLVLILFGIFAQRKVKGVVK